MQHNNQSSNGLAYPKPQYAKERRRRKRTAKERMIEWHNLICDRAKVGDRYQCFHCENLFWRDEVCGDHWPFTKGRRADLKYDPNSGVCCCKNCNRSDSPTRKTADTCPGDVRV